MAGGNKAVRWVAGALAVVLAACVAACAGPPTGGGVKSEQYGKSDNNVFIASRPPNSDMTPRELVQAFLQAITGDDRDPAFKTAQQYLSKDARKAWIPTGQIWIGKTVILSDEDHDYNLEQDQPTAKAQLEDATPSASGDQGEKQVKLVGTQVAQLDSLGFYTHFYGESRLPFSQTFTLHKEDNIWKIDNLPGGFRVLKESDFKRVYQTTQNALPVYLPRTGNRPQQIDQVYLTQATGNLNYTYEALARAVLEGRGGDAGNAIAQLAKPVTVDPSGIVSVDLAPPSPNTDLGALQRALRLTFRAAASSPQLATATPQFAQLNLSYTGCGSQYCGPGSQSLSEAVPEVYWVCKDAIVTRSISDTGAACNPGGKSATLPVDFGKVVTDAPIAVKASGGSDDSRDGATYSVAAVVNAGGDPQVIVASARNGSEKAPWYTSSSGKTTSITDLEWDPDGSLWVVDGGQLYRVTAPVDGKESKTVVPTLGFHVAGFKPSPDGTRAVIVTGDVGDKLGGTPAAEMVMFATDGGPRRLSGESFPLLPGTLGTATDAAWADARTVVLLSTPYSEQQNADTLKAPLKVFKVYSDGSQDSQIVTPEDPPAPSATRIAAAYGTGAGQAPVLWLFSNGTVVDQSGAKTSAIYFKSRRPTDSLQDVGNMPVVAMRSDQ